MQLPQHCHDCKTYQRIWNDGLVRTGFSYKKHQVHKQTVLQGVHPAPWLQDCSLQHPLCFLTGTRNQSSKFNRITKLVRQLIAHLSQHH